MSDLGNLTIECLGCGAPIEIAMSLLPGLSSVNGRNRARMVARVVADESTVREHLTVCPGPPNPGGREPLPVAV